ncbi:hypothetical protein C1646_662739 [Rhizophagus diaphanus]|nr:hypothetical protein C1646_662739 [Rhizophagus diaphanus] [Rhizophagus sp. MUCL 43196]
MSFKCFLSEDGISSKSYIIVLQPERNKYLKWELPSPQATVDLIKSENIKLPVNSYTIFKLNCASAIRESHNFITDTSEVEIIKTTIAIWNCAEESIKEKYNQLNMDLRDLESSAHSGLPEVTPEVMVPGSPLSLNSESGNMTYSSVETSPVLNQDPPMVLIKPPFPPTINIDDLVTSKPNGDKPSKTSNAFIIYRKAYVKELHSRGNYLQMTQISPMVSESWKQEPDSVKAEYKRLAEAAKKRYKEMWPSKQRRRQQRKQQQQQQQLPQSLFIDSKPTNELGLSKLTQTPPQTAIDINQWDFSQLSLWPHQAISPLQNLTEASFGNLKDKRVNVNLEAKKALRFYSDYSEERSQLEREKALKWNKIFNTEFIPIKREFKAIKKELRKVMKAGSPGAYSWNLFQQLDKDVFGAIKRGIEELEKVKVAKCNQGDKMFF